MNRVFPRGLVMSACLISLFSVTAQVVMPDFNKIEVKTHALRNGIYMLEGFGGNIGVSVGEDGTLLVDDQYAPLSAKVLDALSKLSPNKVKYVLNTHHHADHTGGNENFGKRGALIVAHEGAREHLIQEMLAERRPSTAPLSNVALPVLTFNDRMTFHLNGETIEVFHVKSAHTDSDVVVYFRNSNIVHTGDTYFNGVYPFIDVKSGGSINGMIQLYSQLVEIMNEDTLIIPGHGPVSDIEEMRSYQALLSDIRDRVAKGMKNGKSLDELINENILDDLDSVWGQDFVKSSDMIKMTYHSLSIR
ncbi:MAG: MBL fold metallo-hydrolase [Gammaproteobacteria bacterium]|nr:MBL fold metallo-hydrolase [Gammaproteobacteria bacterium]